jgi:hypothetical protein
MEVGPDGRFLLIKNDPDVREKEREAMNPTHIKVVVNWFEELKDLVPIE